MVPFSPYCIKDKMGLFKVGPKVGSSNIITLDFFEYILQRFKFTAKLKKVQDLIDFLLLGACSLPIINVTHRVVHLL